MDSIKVWTTKVIILSIVSIITIATLQIISGLTIIINNQQIIQIITGNITALIIVQGLYALYDTMKSKVEGLWKQTLVGLLTASLSFIFIVIIILLDQIAYTLRGYGSVLASIYLFIAYCVTSIWLTEERIDTFLHNTVVSFLAWFLAGGISAGVLTMSANTILFAFGIELYDNQIVMFGTGIITGGLVASLSVIGRQQALGRVGGQVTMYSGLLARLGRKHSLLLDSILHGENHVITLNPSESREWIESNVPWLLTSLSMTIFLISSTILTLRAPPPNANLLGPVFLLGSACYFAFFTFRGLKVTYQTYQGYKEWRIVWSDFWDLVKLFTMSKDTTAMEYTHRVANKALSELELYSENLEEKLEKLIEIYEINEKIPNELEEQKTMFVNLILYGQLKKQRTEPSPNTELLENELGLLGKVKKILDNTKSLVPQDIRQELAIGTLYASVYDDFEEIPVEMFKDIAPLLTRDWKHEPEICSQCIDQLAVLEDTPKRIIPDSLKWLPAIIPVALWLATVLVG